MNHDDSLLACLWLNAIMRQRGIHRREIISRAKTLSSLNELIGFYSRQINKREEIKAKIQNQLTLARQSQIAALTWLDKDYPWRLRQISGFPLALYWRGSASPASLQSRACLTVIGTRRSSPYGRSATRRLILPLIKKGTVIISGMARGIDSEAHRLALANGGRTIAVLGSGPDIYYPPENKPLYREICRSGCVISEHPPGVPPRKQHFPARNRILSGLADCVAVIEASADSGTMITAGFAADQGREVLAVPGSIFSPFSSGCNQLIRDGAAILLTADDLVPHLPLRGNQISLAELNPKPEANLNHELLPAELSCLLAAGEMTLEQISEQLKITFSRTAALVTRLETAGLIVYRRGRYSLTDEGISCI